MELVGDDAFPRLVNLLLVVWRSQVQGCHGRFFRAVSQVFILAVPTLSNSAGGVAAHAMVGGNKFVIPHGQALFLFLGQQRVHIAEHLVGRGGEYIHGAVLIFTQFAAHSCNGAVLGRAAAVADAVERIGEGEAELIDILFEFISDLVVFTNLAEHRHIGERIQGGVNAVFIYTLPNTQIKRDPVGGAPRQLLCRKAEQVCVVGDGGQCVAEAKAVGQEDILAALAKLLIKVVVAVQDVAEQALRRGDVHIAILIGAAGYVPAAGRHILLEPFELLRIVLLHQLIPVGPFKAEYIFRILFKALKVFQQGFGYVVPDGRLQRPVPGCVQVRGTDRVDARLEGLRVLFHGYSSSMNDLSDHCKVCR